MTTTRDFRALCKKLTDDLEQWVEGYLISDPADECTEASFELIERARTALATQPLETQSVPWANVQKAAEEAFPAWWSNEGSGMPPKRGEEAVIHVERISKIAWSNGAYIAAIIAAPPPEPPTEKDFREMFDENDWNYISPETFEDIARAVLERWGK
jgi:hypothetical protein